MFVRNIIMTCTLLLVTLNSCLGTWSDCKITDRPCIQFKKRLCICTLFWDITRKLQVYKYLCEDMPFPTPRWVIETWECSETGIGNPSRKVWRSYLDPSLKGLKKLPRTVTMKNEWNPTIRSYGASLTISPNDIHHLFS